MAPPGVESMQELRLTSEDGIVCKVVYNDKDLKQFFVAPLLQEVGNLMLGLQDVRQRSGVVVIKIGSAMVCLTFLPFSM